MKSYIINNKKGILLAVVGFIILGIMIVINIYNKNKSMNVTEVVAQSSINIEEADSKRNLSEEQIFNIFISNHQDSISFYSKTFQIEEDVLINKLRNEYIELDLYNQDNFDAFIIEYLFNLEDVDKTLFNNKINPCQDSKEYIVALINYFTKIYPDVAFDIAAGIAQIESNYSSSMMLNKNNVFGGMSNGGLIKYKNIEYGVLKYIKLLNDGYFSKGLVTVEDIGKVFNPMINENGIKVAKPVWVANVTKAMEEFSDRTDMDITTLNTLKNNA